jgi:8-oxo-dGTP diphosphatase
MRRYGEPFKPAMHYRARPGVYAILLRGDDLLLTHQDAPTPEFQLPGGGIDRGEHPVAALHREVFEETGWKIALTRRLGAYRRFVYMPEYDLWAEKICAIYLAFPVRRLGPPHEKGHQAIWTTAQEGLALLANVGDRAFLDQFLRSRPNLP